MDGEIWGTVPSIPRLLVSSEGRVMYLPYRKPVLNGAGERSYSGQPTFGVWNKQDGRFIIVVDGKTYKIHRLIAEAFHGPSPFEGAVVMHVDENAANNRASNLRWGTQKENLNAKGFRDYCRSRTGENSPTAKARGRKQQTCASPLSREEKRARIKAALKADPTRTNSAIALEVDVSQSTVWLARKNLEAEGVIESIAPSEHISDNRHRGGIKL
jgi:acylphosphatase